MADKVVRLSMNPETFTQGGLMSDVDVEVTGAKWCMFDYGGTSAEVPALELILKSLEDDTEETQDWSAGSAKDFEPSEDGEYMTATGSASGFRKSCNAAHFFESLRSCSFPKEKLDGPVSTLIGLRMHVVRKPAPEREGMEERAADSNKRKPTILVCSKIIKLPWETKGKGAAGKGTAGKGTPKPDTKAGAGAGADGNGDGEMDPAVRDAMTELLMEHASEGIAKSELKKLILRLKAATPVKQAMIKMLADEDQLNSLDPAYTINDDQIALV